MVVLADQLEAEVMPDIVRVTQLEPLITQSRDFLMQYLDAKALSWPYVVEDESSSRQQDASYSTTAMIAYAIAALTGGLATGASRALTEWLAPPASHGKESSEWKAVAKVVERLARGVVNAGKQYDQWATSRTFGKHNPFTLFWMSELFHSDAPLWGVAGVRPRYIPRARAIVRQLWQERWLAVTEDGQSPLWIESDRSRIQEEAPPHALPLLRLTQSWDVYGRPTSISSRSTAGPSYVGDAFERMLHRQIVGYETRDGTFDVAQIVFALEGLLIVDREGVPARLFERVLAIVKEAQQRDPNWRPRQPFRANAAGMVQIPLAIEVGNSLLRIFARTSTRQDLTDFWDHRDLAYSLEHRIRADAVMVAPGLRGWRSEHVHPRQRSAHPWQTSQVLLFLASLRAAIEQGAGRKALQLSRFSVRPAGRGSPDTDRWSDFVAGEPSRKFPVYGILDKLFVRPRRAAMMGTAEYSCLLYGPPGTGKTTIARELALALGWAMITITPGDFVVRGADQIEARAKEIFDVLMLQRDVVVLFDEIDRLLLDRSSDAYESQGDMFQFMTPSFLTKLVDLRSQALSVFVIATNYRWRIDEAILRTGRIDKEIPVFPPDYERRRGLLASFIAKTKRKVSSRELEEVAARTALRTYRELEHLVYEADRSSGTNAREFVKQLMREAGKKPSITVEAYDRLDEREKSLERFRKERDLLVALRDEGPART